ncbi:c-type cytochrome [Defluviimonas sp. WL0024]|uniref:C-type cytochrome n=2 Tax=Albidovulum TaxID=205889 RepID=A0ABT3J448_9RHOB|nr:MULTISPECIES: c-type cytochrome [Defluviimonas]MCU9850527.1 c-type cytochrome [Defluviimonas sp. WL0024]MCW3782464.1 c-type cytochrome [Defluviimonas salinarum]
MTKPILTIAALAAALPAASLAQDMPAEGKVKRGEYLVTTSACHDCHTPFKMGENGPEWDMDRMLSGHPESEVITGGAVLDGPWAAAVSMTNTAWSGPWGVSFTANLTPDPETGGLRDYSEEQFIAAMRSGRHLGQGRPILPPMPWPVYGQMTDEDLSAIYAYLRQIPAVRNKVPEPLPPAALAN